VLKVISSSPGELQPVFNALLATATRLCGAQFGLLNLREQDEFHNVAVYNVLLFTTSRLRSLLIPEAAKVNLSGPSNSFTLPISGRHLPTAMATHVSSRLPIWAGFAP
jgi:hypothetical protein